MLFEEYLAQNEGKILEFKENTRGTHNIVKTIIAFANTSGGVLIFGIRDKTKEIMGIQDALLEEERLANIIADSISPLLIPDMEIHSYRNKEFLVIRVHHGAGPYFLKSEGPERGVYVRFGSTNRIADSETLSALKLFSSNKTFDELPQVKAKIDWNLVEKAFASVKKVPTQKKCEMLGIFTSNHGKECSSIGGVLLFGSNHLELFPDSIIRCARFGGTTKEKILDQVDVTAPLPFALEEIVTFIERNTQVKGEIGRIAREDIPEYPPIVIREAVVNALLHCDYSIKGCNIQVAIFDDRIELTNPGGLPFGQTIEKAISGFSRLRNRVIGRVFRELKLIEQWGSGLQRILSICDKQGFKLPLIEEQNNQFRVTLYSIQIKTSQLLNWQNNLVNYLKKSKSISTKEAAKIWKLSDRAARTRLKAMINEGIVKRIATSEKDPHAVFVLME